MPVLTVPVNEHDHSLGPADAATTLVEYGDFECPNCGEAYPILNEVLDRLGNQLRFVYRHFPLNESHPHARQAAEASEAAASQGKFWEMHDLLFEHQDALEASHLREYARSLGLDLAKFDRDMQEHIYADRVRADFLSGVRSGVNGTPTFYINGERYEGSWDVRPLTRALENTIQSDPTKG